MLFELLVPPYPILAAIVASIAMPFLLVGYARGPFRRLTLGRRFGFAMGTAASAWILATIWIATSANTGTPTGLIFDVLAGAAIFMTASLVIYSIWALASFGYTTLMLVCLGNEDKPLTIDDWAAAYGHGYGMYSFAHDRVAVLTGTGLATRHDNQIRISGPLAGYFASFVVFVANVFAIDIEK